MDPPSFAGSRSMAENYNAQGVHTYYQCHGAEYRNPHFQGIMNATFTALHGWVCQLFPQHPELSQAQVQALTSGPSAPPAVYTRVLSASAPSQEQEAPATPVPDSAEDSVADIEQQAAETAQPPAVTQQATAPDSADPGSTPRLFPIPGPVSSSSTGHSSGPCLRVLDLACGSGEATQSIAAWWHATGACQGPLPDDIVPSVCGLSLAIDATDPYTGAAFTTWTGHTAETFSFQDVASGCLLDAGRSYHLIVCSYAMHVLDHSYLHNCLQQLALVCEALLILSPHKLPQVESRTGWELVQHWVVDRVHARLYQSTHLVVQSDLALCEAH